MKKFQRADTHISTEISYDDYNNLEEFYEHFNKGYHTFRIILSTENYSILIGNIIGQTAIIVKAPTRFEIDVLMEDLTYDMEKYKIVLPEKVKKQSIFIGHGGSSQWRDLKDHLYDIHGYEVETFESKNRAGLSNKEVFESLLEETSLAFLVFTGEDEMRDGKMNARLNVVHELGLFQGRKGFSKAIMLKEEGTEEFSNMVGVQQIKFGKNNIKEAFGQVLAKIKEELAE